MTLLEKSIEHLETLQKRLRDAATNVDSVVSIDPTVKASISQYLRAEANLVKAIVGGLEKSK